MLVINQSLRVYAGIFFALTHNIDNKCIIDIYSWKISVFLTFITFVPIGTKRKAV
jgi:hypothetical protein